MVISAVDEGEGPERPAGEPTSSDSPALDGCPRLVLSSAPATALAPDARPPATTAREFSPCPLLGRQPRALVRDSHILCSNLHTGSASFYGPRQGICARVFSSAEGRKEKHPHDGVAIKDPNRAPTLGTEPGIIYGWLFHLSLGSKTVHKWDNRMEECPRVPSSFHGPRKVDGAEVSRANRAR